jgi:predicted DCC family thiol-disulfide oxidoreductase YuxK
MTLGKPLVIFDGNCGFCRKWIERWRELTGDSVDYEPSQKVAANFPAISAEEFDREVQLIRPDGSRAAGAEAVFEITAPHSVMAKIGLGAYRRSQLIAALSESAYGMVASHRAFFSWLTKMLWGNSTLRPSYAIANGLFLRLLALVFLIFLISYQVQSPGLVGSNGILPVGGFFEAVRQHGGGSAYWMLPSLAWISPGDRIIEVLVLAGTGAALLALAGILQPLCFLTLWAVTLSLVVAGQDFYNFQWDALLIETGFVAIFLAPWKLKPNWQGVAPPRLARFVAVALLFRLMFSSGVVKLSSGDPTWRNLEALQFHFFTQPLPNPLSWFAHQLPFDILWAACGVMFFIELLLPFGFFLPRIPRLIAAWGTIGLQALIALTGNYAFFNVLTIILCLFLIDDRSWPRCLQSVALTGYFVSRWLRIPVCLTVLGVSLVPLCMSFRVMPGFLKPLTPIYSQIAPFRTVNSYGLFAMMTTERREIIIQGSNDGHTWKDYVFKWKPGPLDRALPVVAPYQPRLDWQMWFAALSRMETTPWFQSLLIQLLRGNPEVLHLLEDNPFPDTPPRLIRAISDFYTFTTPEQRWKDGAIWQRQPAAIYCPEVSLRSAD